jgi:hypothetical protein
MVSTARRCCGLSVERFNMRTRRKTQPRMDTNKHELKWPEKSARTTKLSRRLILCSFAAENSCLFVSIRDFISLSSVPIFLNLPREISRHL